MDVRFDTNAAEQLIREMDKYCSGVQKEMKKLLLILNDSGEWKDNQMRAFQTNIRELATDLNQALSFESEYMRTYQKRVLELRG